MENGNCLHSDARTMLETRGISGDKDTHLWCISHQCEQMQIIVFTTCKALSWLIIIIIIINNAFRTLIGV